MKKLIIISCALIMLFNCTGCATLASYFVPEEKDNYFDYLNPMSGFNEIADKPVKAVAAGLEERAKTKSTPENTVLTIIMTAVIIAGPIIGATMAYKETEPHVRNGAYIFGVIGAGLGLLVSCIIDVVLWTITSSDQEL